MRAAARPVAAAARSPGTSTRVCPPAPGPGSAVVTPAASLLPSRAGSAVGRGIVVDDPCPTCTGSGQALSTRTLRARIPAGVHDGQRIRLKGKGQPGQRGGPAGDVVVLVHVQPHQVFGRKGDNLTLTLPGHVPGGGARCHRAHSHTRRHTGVGEDSGGHDGGAHDSPNSATPLRTETSTKSASVDRPPR